MMQPALRRWKINERQTYELNVGGSVHKVQDKKISRRELLGGGNQSAQNMYSNNRIDGMHGAQAPCIPAPQVAR